MDKTVRRSYPRMHGGPELQAFRPVLYAFRSMSLVFYLRRAFDRGTPVGSAKVFIAARGTLTVGEARDDHFRRVVRTANFARNDEGEPVPPLRDVELLQWGSAIVLTGVEEIADDKLSRPRLYAQTWQLAPEADTQLQEAERLIGRLINRLRKVGVPVQMLPGGGALIPGERRPDGEPVDGG